MRRSARWSQYRSLLGDRHAAITALVVSSVLSGLVESGILAVLASVAATLVNGGTHVRFDVGPFRLDETVGTFLTLAASLAFLRLALQSLVSFLPARIAADIQARLCTELLAAFTSASWSVQSRDREGHLQEMVTEQVAYATQGALQAAILLTALLTFLVLVVSALIINVVVALTVLVTAAALFGILRPLGRLGNRRAHALSRASMNYAGEVSEVVRLAEEAQVFGVTVAQRHRLDRLVAAVRGHFFTIQLLARLVPGIYQSLIYLILVGGLATLYATGSGHVASLGAVVLLLVRAGSYGQQAQGAYQSMHQALPYAERLQEAQRGYDARRQPTDGRALTRVQTLAFECVSYAYGPGRPALSDVSFEATAGDTIGIVGPSGAGKSTLVQILLRLRAPCRGRYLINGDPAEQFAREDWHRLVAYVPQEPRLLHASVADNIRFFRNLDNDAVQRAARLAGIHDDIMKWSDGYDTTVGPRADAVSGGQQQRICLARALAAEPQVLVLDEPTSALDPHSERLIQDSLVALKGELTLFVVAHRMSTLQMCERVMAIVDGRLQAFDTVDRLQLDSSYYRSASALAAGAPSILT